MKVLREQSIGGGALRLLQGDITQSRCDAIVNAANSSLMHGGGVAAAISRAAGPELQRESREVAPVPTGGCKATAGYGLPAKYVLHAVGPIYGREGGREPELLASAVRSALDLAAQMGLASVAMPAVSGGIYGYPLGDCARIHLAEIRRALEGALLERVDVVLFDRAAQSAFCAEFDETT